MASGPILHARAPRAISDEVVKILASRAAAQTLPENDSNNATVNKIVAEKEE